jgi:hypothetical protein
VMTRCLIALAAVLGALAVVPAALAAGPPLPTSATGRAGALAPGGSERLLARRDGRDTLVVAVRRGDGTVLRSRRIGGRWSIPAVTLYNGTTGLSADGATLVLAHPTKSFPSHSTRLAILDAQRLLVRRHITLPGFFTVDAISPDGRWLYLIQYGDSVLDYRVRALDTRSGRLARGDIVDPRKPDEQMGGLPMTRAMSRDGRWVYTLYGGGRETFIHALDTVGRTAACIDLEMLPAESDMSGVRLSVSGDGRRIDVQDRGRLVAMVDARTFHVREPGAAPPLRRQSAPAPTTKAGSDDASALVLAAGALGLIAAALALARRRSRSPRRA